MFKYLAAGLILTLVSCSKIETAEKEKDMDKINGGKIEKAVFAGGCFWCLEAPFENLDGVYKVVSGYAGGTEETANYEDVSSGRTAHVEAVQVLFNPEIISYAEILDIYWKQFDPTDKGGSFQDRGPQYESVIFYMNESQKNIAVRSKERLNNSGIFEDPIVTPVEKFTTFFPAEEYHQDYYKFNESHYMSYKKASGREDFIKGLWGDDKISKYRKPESSEIKTKVSDIQYKVTQQCGTEPPFNNEYWNNKEEGIYVDVVSGEPLFSSKDKYDSGSGWPSFTKPIDTRFVRKFEDNSHNMNRVEVKSNFGGSHLGHVFPDGPNPTNLRYCINSASLKFIAKNEMEKEGYGDYLWIFN